MRNGSFAGLRVLALESRRASELTRLIEAYGGRPTVAPSLREVPRESNTAALDFAAGVLLGDYDITIFLTGVGVRTLYAIVEHVYAGDQFLAALSRTKVVARGPKPSGALRELNVPIWVIAPEPNTWREVLVAMDAADPPHLLAGARIAVQEYGVPHPDLVAALERRGALVTSVPVYRWELPEDIEPLRQAVTAIANGAVDVLLLVSGVQLAHLQQVAGMMGCEAAVRRGFAGTVIASIGPTTTEEIRRQAMEPDLQASHPKLGYLVKEAAEQSAALLRAKRQRSAL
jgi:uroporphyrinogen-III synthase